MFSPFIALAMSLSSQDTATYEVISVTQNEVFAGKNGNRVHRTVTLRGEGRTITINLAPYHDRFKPEPKTPRAGEKVRLSELR